MELLKFLAVFVCSLLGIYSLGWLIHFLLLKKVVAGAFQTLFMRLMLGLVVLVAGYSIMKSGGKTFNLSLLPVLLFGYLEYRKFQNDLKISGQNPTWWPGWQPMLVLLTSGVLYMLYKFQMVHTNAPFPYALTHGADYAYYSLVSTNLQTYGIETKLVPDANLSEYLQGLLPYHYFDLWLNAFISQVSGQINFLTMELVTYPIFMVIAFTGIVALWESSLPVHWVVWLVAFFLIGFGSVHLGVYNEIFYLSKINYRLNHFGEGVLGMQKLLQYLPFGLAFGLLILKRHYMFAFLTLITLSMVYFSALVLLGVLGLFVLVNLAKPVWVTRKNAFLIGVYGVVVFGVFVLVYKLWGKDISSTKGSFSLKLFDPVYAKTRVNIIGLSTIQVTAMYLPIVLGLILTGIAAGKKVLNNKLLLLVLLCCSIYGLGLLTWSVALENPDGMQLLGNNMPVLNMLLLATGVYLLAEWKATPTSNKVWLFLGLALWVGLPVFKVLGNTYNSIKEQHDVLKHSEEYKLYIQGTNINEKLLIGGYLKGDSEYQHPEYSPAHKMSYSFKEGPYLVFMPQYFSTISLSVFDFTLADSIADPLGYQREKRSREESLFYRFVQKQKDEGTFVSLGQSQVDFIKFHDLKYLIATKSAYLHEELNDIVNHIETDPNTGERFILFK